MQSNNNNCMSVIQTNIVQNSNDSTTNDLTIFEQLLQTSWSLSAKFEIEELQRIRAELEKTQMTILDCTIYSLIKMQKLTYKDYRILFIIFFKEEIFRYYYYNYGHKKFSKFLKKIFSYCMNRKNNGLSSNNIFSNFDIGEFINIYILELYKLISEEKKDDKDKITSINETKDMKKLHIQNEQNIKKLENLDEIDKKFMKVLIKYILAFCNVLKDNKHYRNYNETIFEIFSHINDTLFQTYFNKQLYKIYLNKGIYEHGNSFIWNNFYPIYESINIAQSHFTPRIEYLIKSVLNFRPKYLNNKKMEYSNKSSIYFLNIPVLIKITNNLLLDKNKVAVFLMKLVYNFNKDINLFKDDDTQTEVAELILTDTINNHIIMNSLDRMELIKHYINEIDNIDKNDKYWQYFEYLFFDLSMDEYLFDNQLGNISINITTSFNSQIPKELNKDAINTNIIIKKFSFSQDLFINYYFNDNNQTKSDEDTNIILSQKNLEALFILLDIIYKFSIESDDEKKVEESIKDIQRLIILIITKTYEEKKYNCTIFNFLLNIDPKYFPSKIDFNIFSSNSTILLQKSFPDFIKTYPYFIIFLINYFSKRNENIKQFLEYIREFIEGYSQKVYEIIDKDYKSSLQLDYLKIFYFVINQILIIYLGINTENIFTTNKIVYLPYCIRCFEKLKNRIVLSKYLSRCYYCGEKNLFINANLNRYLSNHKNEVNKFAQENIWKALTNITEKIIMQFKEKYEKRNDLQLFSYYLHYKIMSEHFQFLNEVQHMIGKNIPFVNDNLNKIINIFFENYFTKNKQYPFAEIYKTIKCDEYIQFNCYRKTIKHEISLLNNKYAPN